MCKTTRNFHHLYEWNLSPDLRTIYHSFMYDTL